MAYKACFQRRKKKHRKAPLCGGTRAGAQERHEREEAGSALRANTLPPKSKAVQQQSSKAVKQ